MSDVGITPLVGPLLNATREGRLVWEEDPTGGYLTRVGPNTINIYESDIGYPSLIVRVINIKGKVVDSLELDRNDADYTAAREIFDHVRRISVNEVVGDILAHLNAGS